jgi:integrase
MFASSGKLWRTVTEAVMFGSCLVAREIMAGIIKHARLESPSARDRLKRRRQPHWQALVEGKVHLGWQCWKGEPAGRWILRRYIGKHKSGEDENKLVAKYRISTLGLADDGAEADGDRVLNYEQAKAKALAMIGAQNGNHRSEVVRTVRQAFDHYIEFKRSEGKSVADVLSRGTAHILPTLGNLLISELTSKELRDWLATMAASPAQIRPKKGKVQYRPAPEGDEAIRRRRATANRVLTMLKAILNHAYDEGHVPHRDAWGRKLKPFESVDAARIRYLSIAEAKRLINACDADFRPLVRAALETGARYSELARLEVLDFNPDSGTIAVRQSKSGEARHIILTEEGASFFHAHCAGRAGHELMFGHEIEPRKTTEQAKPKQPTKSPWKTAEQARPMREANERAKLKPSISFHGLRHTWASHAVMNGVPLIIVAKNLGHKDTRMVEKHYGHLAPSYVADAIRAGAPKFGIKPDTKVTVLR